MFLLYIICIERLTKENNMDAKQLYKSMNRSKRARHNNKIYSVYIVLASNSRAYQAVSDNELNCCKNWSLFHSLMCIIEANEEKLSTYSIMHRMISKRPKGIYKAVEHISVTLRDMFKPKKVWSI